MPAIAASSPGKVILFGEHAVVYGFPAIAIPVFNVKSNVYISPDPKGKPDQIFIDAPDIDLHCYLNELPEDNPTRSLILEIKSHLGIKSFPAFKVRIKSKIPIAAGLGSGASISISTIRAITGFLGVKIDNEDVSKIAYEIEKIYHGTPSGIDNTVITYQKPIYFVKGKPFQFIKIKKMLTLIIADSGIKSLTSEVVNELRERYEENKNSIQGQFITIGKITEEARRCLSNGNLEKLGDLMNQNHKILASLGVSNSTLDRLVDTALSSGALGAKLSGAGKGGNMIALVEEKKAQSIASDLIKAGAVNTIITDISPRD